MAIPGFLLRKLYKRGSLRVPEPGWLSFTLHNVLGNATITLPPDIVINGMQYAPEAVIANEGTVDLAKITRDRPMEFNRGDQVHLKMEGHLLRGANRIHVTVQTKEWGELEIFVDERSKLSDEEE